MKKGDKSKMFDDFDTEIQADEIDWEEYQDWLRWVYSGQSNEDT